MKPIPKYKFSHELGGSAPLLAFGAHPDDIEFGCGGVIASEAASGRASHLVVCSNGEAASNGTPAQRIKEAWDSAQILSATLEFFDLGGDCHFDDLSLHALGLAEIIRTHRPRIILAPTVVANQHPDHSRLGSLVRDAARLARYAGLDKKKTFGPHAIEQLYFYAVTMDAEPKDISPMLFDVSDPTTVQTWTKAMKAHASQSKTRDYVQLQLTRARLNGLRAGVSHAISLFPNDPVILKSFSQITGARAGFDMAANDFLKIGITCYPTVGGSGILASALGEALAHRGHEVHFICYERPFRLPANAPRLDFHPVEISDYGLFKYPDYTLPLSVKMAEVTRDYGLDILHVHYAVPHATAAILARSMLPPSQQPKVVTTLHGTDTTLLGRDKGYGPAIRHALACSDAITTVSSYLKNETQRLLEVNRPIDVIHNFFQPRPPRRSREQVRRELGIDDKIMILHSSNLRPTKRIDLLLETIALIKPRDAFKLVILAGEDFSPFIGEIDRLGLHDQVIVRDKVNEIEEYLQAADLGLYSSDMESFCLGILEGMCFSCPSVSTNVGGIPEVIKDNITGLLAPSGDAASLARAVQSMIEDPSRRRDLGRNAQNAARELFSAEVIVPQYEALYRRA